MSANDVVQVKSADPRIPGRDRTGKVTERIGGILFWGWNLFFLALMALGFAPLTLPNLIQSVRDGITPVRFLVESLIIILIPVVATVIAATVLRRNPSKQFALGYVVEWPLMLILLVRFFVLRQGNPAITVLLVWLAIAELTFLWHLVDRRQPEGISMSQRFLRLGGLTLLFAGTIYSAAWLLFYVPPFFTWLWELISGFGDQFSFMIDNPHYRWYDVPLAVLSTLVLIFSMTLIVMMPVAAPILAAKAWWRALRSALNTAEDGIARVPAVLGAMLIPLAVVLIILGTAMRQPQQAAFTMLEKPPETVQQAQSLAAHEDDLRAGLLNAYLASYRYLASAGEVNHIRDLYQMTLKMNLETAFRIERYYEGVLSPFLYRPVAKPEEKSASPGPIVAASPAMQAEQRQAAEYYERYFDQPIADGERESIVAAVRSTSDRAQAEMAWQAVDDREVHLTNQDVTVSEHGDWAEVLLHETYRNLTPQNQEVVYYFSLPESAVITGLWLGGTPDRAQAFTYQVAPRGAAQQIYREEVRYMRDPALVEQIGPRQYRLRAFPVGPRGWDQENNEYVPGPEMHLWMEYRVMQAGGGWPLPQLAEHRNVYWDGQSERAINGTPVPGTQAEWLPASVAASQPVTPAAHRVDFPDGTSVLALPTQGDGATTLPTDLRVAVVLDRSFSMRDRAGEVSEAFAVIQRDLGATQQPDVYLTASAYRGEQPARVELASFQPSEVLYFGGQNAAELLAQYQELSVGEAYDLVLLLTDGSGYELGDGGVEVAVPGAPLWVVHLGGGFPLGYDDATQQAIQASGGGVAGSVDEALARYAVSREAPGRTDVVDGYLWQTVPTGEAGAAAAADDGFAALAARRVLLAEMAKNQGDLSELPILDSLHALAVEQGIVTPYSSMIVLVNDRQERKLDELSEGADRYAREVEEIGLTEELGPLAVTGVPEPEEWLLIALVAALLLYANREKVKAAVGRLGNHGATS